jgi:hypothetical protein
MPAQRTDVHGSSRAAFGIFQIKAGAECLRPARENDDRGVAIVLKTACGIGELSQRFRRQRIDAVAPVEAHHGDAPLGPEALLDFDKLHQHPRSLSAIFFQR